MKSGIIKVDPIGKPRMTQSDKWKKRDCVVKYWDYCDQIRAEVGDIDFEVTAIFIMALIPMPKSWSKQKRKEKTFTRHDKKPDSDNIAKGFMDAILEDDSTVSSLAVQKIWAEEGLIKYEMR